MKTVRKAVFKDMFYPADSKELSTMIDNFLKNVKIETPSPKAIIAPHAGYIYSGETAAIAFNCLKKNHEINQVIVIAPSHRHYFEGVALTQAQFFETPLGQIKIDQQTCHKLISQFDGVHYEEDAFNKEHAVEVELPFLQKVLRAFELIPLIVGQTSSSQLIDIIDFIWNSANTLIVVSSDLSHYHRYVIANQIDHATSMAIENLLPEKIAEEQACGRMAILALLKLAKKNGLKCKCIDLCNSGDKSGNQSRVVGYGAFHFYEQDHKRVKR